jgi:hypothetical protein
MHFTELSKSSNSYPGYLRPNETCCLSEKMPKLSGPGRCIDQAVGEMAMRRETGEQPQHGSKRGHGKRTADG